MKVVTNITKEQTKKTHLKFKYWEQLTSTAEPGIKQRMYGWMKKDPTLFAYHFFTAPGSMERLKLFPWQDAFVNDPSDRKLAVISRQVGKSTSAAVLALHRAFFEPNALVLVVAPTKPQSFELVQRMRTLMNTSRFTIWKELQPNVRESAREIRLKNATVWKETTNGRMRLPPTWSRIIVAPATNAARGYSANLAILDEADTIEDGHEFYQSVFEPIVDATGGDIVVLGTPVSRAGLLWKFRNSEEIGFNTYHVDWRAKPDRTEEWARKKRASTTALAWAAEYEAKFVLSTAAYFSQKEVDEGVSDDAGLGWTGEEGVVVGVDFGKINDHAIINIGCLVEGTDKDHPIVKVLERRVKPLGTNYDEVIGELKAINKLMKPQLFVLDATGVGEAPADVLKSSGLQVEAIKFSVKSKADIMGNLKILFQQKRMMIPREDELYDQLTLFEYKYTEAGNILLHHPDGGHDDEVDSLALMAYGLAGGIKTKAGIFVLEKKSTEPNATPTTQRLHVCSKCENYFNSFEGNRNFMPNMVCLNCKQS